MILDRNVDPASAFPKQHIVIPVNEGASITALEIGSVIAAFVGKIVSAIFYCEAITDADDSVTIDLHKNGVSILAAAVDPVAADTTTTLAPTAAGSILAVSDRIALVVTTGAGDALRGSLTLVVRPYLGTQERIAAGLGDS